MLYRVLNMENKITTGLKKIKLTTLSLTTSKVSYPYFKKIFNIIGK